MNTESPELTLPTIEDLEREKLLLEIAELKRNWWKRPAYIAALFPTLLALTTLVYGFANGYFQASFVKLENQKYELQKEVDSFAQMKTELGQENQRLKDHNNQLFTLKSQLADQVNHARDDVANLVKNETFGGCPGIGDTSFQLRDILDDLTEALKQSEIGR